jgi:hypothetical protein
MRNLVTIMTVVLLAMSAGAHAASYWDACDSCSQQQQVTAAIRLAPTNTLGLQDVYLMDFERGSVQKYEVLTLYDPRDGGYMSYAQRVTTEAHIAYEFEHSVAAIKADIESLRAGTEIPEEIAASAYDIVHSALLQQRVSDYVNEHLTIWQSIGAPVSVPLSALGKIVNLNLYVPVTFSDGSTAKLVLTGLEGSLTDIRYSFELMEGSVRDADGNLIPETPAAAAPYQAEFATQPSADQMMDFILRWYAEEGRRVTCYSEVSSGGITVICKRR